jgi:hypothetical protein
MQGKQIEPASNDEALSQHVTSVTMLAPRFGAIKILPTRIRWAAQASIASPPLAQKSRKNSHDPLGA